MHCSIPIAFFTLFPSLLAGPLPQEDWKVFNDPLLSNQALPNYDFDLLNDELVLSYNDQVLPSDGQLLLNDHQLFLNDADISAGYDWDNDIELATTGGLEVFDGSADPPMSSIETDTPLLESSCDTADELAYGKLRARDGPVCLKKAPSSQLFRFPNIIQFIRGSNTVPQPTLLTGEGGDDDTCTSPFKVHLCCDWMPGLDPEASAGGAPLAVWFKLVHCHPSMMIVLLYNTISIAKRAQVFPERLAPGQILWTAMCSRIILVLMFVV
jgi:hypothetical protein